MQQVALASNGPICQEVQNKLPLVVSPLPHSLATAVDALSLPWEDLDAYAFPPAAILGKVVEKLQDSPCKRIILIIPGWPNTPWFWDLVTMSSQIPLSLPNLLTQPFNQIPHRNLTNLNLHSWLLEPLQSRSRASLRQWQQELSLLKEDQSDQPMRQSGPFLQSGVSLIRWTSGHPPVKSVADFLMYLLRTGSYSPAPLMVTGQPLLINWEIHPSTSARRKISFVSWIVSIETGPKAGGESPSGTSHWSCTS